MKKILLLLALCTLLAAGCAKEEATLTERTENENVTENQPVTEIEPIIEDKKLSSEEAAEIYLSHKSVWEYSEEYSPMQGYGYCLLDLDFDGVCELIKNVNNGSGRYSYNEYYRINQKSLEVEKITAPDMEYGNGYDYCMFDGDVRLLMSVSDNSRFYFCKNLTRVTTGEYAIDYGKMYLSHEGIRTEILFSEYHDEKDWENPDNQLHMYTVKNNGAFQNVDKETYDEYMIDFYRRNYDSELKWTCIDGMDFADADRETQKQMLTDACNSFTYVLFFYD